MTNAQRKVHIEQISAYVNYERRKFRKKCVTLGIVEFKKKISHTFYEVYYRGCFVCTLFKSDEDSLKLLAVWNTIYIAESNNRKD